jgi:hypothetical protein
MLLFSFVALTKIPPAIASRWDLQLDINVDGQVLPLVVAQVLTTRASILQSFLIIDGKFEV